MANSVLFNVISGVVSGINQVNSSLEKYDDNLSGIVNALGMNNIDAPSATLLTLAEVDTRISEKLGNIEAILSTLIGGTN